MIKHQSQFSSLIALQILLSLGLLITDPNSVINFINTNLVQKQLNNQMIRNPQKNFLLKNTKIFKNLIKNKYPQKYSKIRWNDYKYWQNLGKRKDQGNKQGIQYPYQIDKQRKLNPDTQMQRIVHTTPLKTQHSFLLIITIVVLSLASSQPDTPITHTIEHTLENAPQPKNSAAQQLATPTTASQQVKYTTGDAKPMSASDKQRMIQQEELTSYYKKYPMVEFNNEFSFEVKNAYEQFHFHLPTDQYIHFLIRIYVLKNNIYNQIDNIQSQPALHTILYENNHRIVAEKSFYYQNAISIDGKGGSTYMIRFYSPNHKLVIVTHNKFVQSSHFEGKIKNDQMQQINNKLTVYMNKLNYIFKLLRTTYRIQFEERALITQKFDKFSMFEILEMVIIVLMCIIQVKVINKLFKNDSIV